MALRDILVKFGIDVDRKPLIETDAAIRKTILSAERFGNTLKRLSGFLIAGALVTGIKNFVEGQLDAAVALKFQAERLGISTEELQKYQYAASTMGVSTKETAIAMRYFNRAVGEAQLGTKGAVKTFQTLGMLDSVKQLKPTNELLFEFSDKLKGVKTQAERVALASRLLGRNGAAMIPMLQKGSKELKEIFKDIDELGGGYNAAFIEQSQAVNVQLKRLKFAWRSIYVAVATEVLPIAMKWIASGIRTAKILIDLAKHTYAFRTALMFLAGGATVFALMRLLKIFNPFKASIKDIMLALLSNAPLVAFVALITLAYFAIDDLYTFMKGGDSVIGRFLEYVGGKGTALTFWHQLKDAFDRIGAAIGPVIPQLKNFLKGVVETFVTHLPDIIEWGGIFATVVVGAIDMAITGLRELGEMVLGIAHIMTDIREGRIGDIGGDIGVLGNNLGSKANGLQDRLDAYGNLIGTFKGLGNPKAIPKSTVPLPGGGITPSGGLGLPPPPAPAGGGKLSINITNNIGGEVDSGTLRGINNATKTAVKSALNERRDTYGAIGAGMPASGLG